MIKILRSLLLITAVAAAAGYGTWSNLHQDKSSGTMTLSSMPFDFDVEFGEDDDELINIVNINGYSEAVAPGDTGKGTIQVKNHSMYDGNLSLTIDVTGDNENGRTAQELIDDNTTTAELCDSVQIALFDEGDNSVTGNWATLNDFDTKALGIVQARNEARTYTLKYQVPTSVKNEILSDTCVFKAKFELVQIPGFQPQN